MQRLEAVFAVLPATRSTIPASMPSSRSPGMLDRGGYRRYELTHSLDEGSGVEVTPCGEPFPVAAADLPEAVFAIDPHGERRSTVVHPMRVWEDADQVVEGGEPDRAGR